MALAFSSSDRAVIEQAVNVTQDTNRRAADLEAVYETERCASWINDHGYQTVALQFPDEMLVDSVKVTVSIQKRVTADLYVLGDTSYGSCCIDEVAAEHVQADSIVHFGHSCLSRPSRLPVLFVFGNAGCDLAALEEGLQNTFTDRDTKMVVLFDTQYNYCKDDIFRTVQNSFKNAVPSNLVIPSTHPDDRSGATDSTIIKCSRSVILPPSSSIEDYVLLYIGPESRTLTNVMFTFNQCHCYSFNPQTKCLRKESVSVNRHMMRRYYMIEKAKDAKIVGILVGTLGVLHYLSVLSHLKNLIRRAGKKSYTLAVGKLNVAKLANFQEVDVYVLVACPENTLLDSKEFFRPVVTPFELEVALNPSRQWSQAFTANFGDILPGGDHFAELQEQTGQPDYDFSLVTGMLRRIGVEQKSENLGSESALVTKDGTVSIPHLHTGAAGEFLMRRTWQGLEPKLGKTPAAEICKGQSGLAAGYVGEGDTGRSSSQS